MLLEASALTVVRGRRTVLSGVSLELTGGRALHLAGANGSGKTSLLRVLAGLASPRAGRLQRRGACAFVPEKVVLASAMQPREWLAAMHRLRGLEPVDWPAAAEASGLDPDVLDRSSATFSKGMLQRIALLEALESRSPLLLLDEPFAGLDHDGRDWLARRLATRLDEGAAALLTDHSGAAGDRLALAGELRLHDGTAALAPATAPHVSVVASHPDGRRLERRMQEADSDEPAARTARGRLAHRGGAPVSARLRYVLLSAARTRTPLVPAAASIFAVLGVFAYRGNEVGESWGLTAVLSCGLAAWLVGAVLAGEPQAQADMATAALGGRKGRARLELVPIALAAAGLTVAFIAYPLLTSPLGSTPMFVPAARPGDVVAAALGHACCAILGGAVAVLFAAPRLVRRATAVAATTATLLALVAIESIAGPVAVAQALDDAPRGTVPGAEITACLTCLALAALALLLASRWARRTG